MVFLRCSAIFCQVSAIFCQRDRWNVVEVETVETGGRVQGVTGWSHDRGNNVKRIAISLINNGKN